MKKRWVSPSQVLLAAGVLAGILVVVVVGFYIWQFHGGLSYSRDVWGQFGDFFGGTLNPIFSFFTLIALLYTVFIQIQVNAESDSRHDEQMLDARLFQLLSVNMDIAKGVRVYCSVNGEPRVFEGVGAVSYVWHEFSTGHLSELARGDEINIHDGLMAHIRIIRRGYWESISSYYDSTQFVVDFISKYGRDSEFTRFSLAALKSQMTIQARALLFYVMIYSHETCRFIPVLMECGFWDDVTQDPLAEFRTDIWRAAAAFHQA